MGRGPLSGIKVIELPNIGPTQFAGMALGDLGAEVLRLDRATSVASGEGTMPASAYASLDRNRRSVGVDLKHPDGVATVLRLCERADVLIEGFRPGVAERLGVGPDDCRGRNPRLVYGRMTGWGQDGPLANDVGHDINYISLAGVLAHIGTAGGPPVPPINLVGDFGGGGLLLAFGILAALVERGISGEGQVVDAAMVDGAAMQMSVFVGLSAMGFWSDDRGTNLLDGGAHFYGVYETSDGEYVSIASYEPQFYAELVATARPARHRARPADPDGPVAVARRSRCAWPTLFRTRTRDEWVEFFAGHDVCFAPGPHDERGARASAQRRARARSPRSTARRSPRRRPASRARPVPSSGRRSSRAPTPRTALADWGFSEGEVTTLREYGAVA